MKQKDLSKLKKPELLRIMLDQQKEIQRLEAELAKANRALLSRRTGLQKAGSIAEASLALTNVFQEAQKAADGYLENIRALAEEGETDDPDPPPLRSVPPDLPSVQALEGALDRMKYRRRLSRMLRTTAFSLVVTLKGGGMKTGDIVAFYYNNKVLVKRVIGQAGQWIDIGSDGTVFVDNFPIDEPYLREGAKALGECSITLPYQVPEARIFVMGDNRATSVDSRTTTVGCVSEEQLVGRVVFRVWPLNRFGSVT